MKNSTNWTNWETGFLVMIVVTNIQRSQAIDAEHARNAAIFRLVVTLTGIVGMIVVQVLKRKNPPPAPLPTVPEGTAEGVAISYTNTRAILWRGIRTEIRHSPLLRQSSLGLVLLFSLPLTGMLWQKWGALPALGMLPVTLAVVGLGVVAFMALISWLSVLQRCPTPTSTRAVTTEIRPDGVVDRTPEKLTLIPWSNLRRVFVVEGDMFIEGNGGGCWIPREAFNDGDSEKYRAMIEALWKSNGTRWPEFAPTTKTPHPE